MPPTSPATSRARSPFPLTFWGHHALGTPAFKEEYLDSSPETVHGRAYGHYNARLSRYAIFWAYFSNTVYSRIHRWGDTYKDRFDLHGFIRNIYSPAYRLGEFWANHLMGGALDKDAGDGKEVPNALPIVTDHAYLRPVISRIWKDSNWQANKEVFARYGAVLGDTALAVVDDPAREKVYLRVVHPGTIRHVERDVFGNVKAYVIEERRPDPEWDRTAGDPPEVTYREVCWRDDDGTTVHYATYRDDDVDPYDWRDYPPGTPDSARVGGEWSESYGFVPLIVTNHRDMGAGWGWSEFQPGLSRFREVDDLASRLHDQIDKVIQAPQLVSGVTAKEVQEWDDATGRHDLPYLFTEAAAASATSLAGDLDIAGTAAEIAAMLLDLERMYPELKADEAGADASGAARRIAREKVEATVIERRAIYDAALVRAHQMAFSIAVLKGYPGYEGLPGGEPDALYESGAFDHAIGSRPVFTLTAAERLEEATARGAAVQGFVNAGFSFRQALIEVGYTETQADLIVADKEKEADAAMERQAKMQAMGFDAEGEPDADSDPEDGAEDDNANGNANQPPTRAGTNGPRGAMAAQRRAAPPVGGDTGNRGTPGGGTR
jgi:hypothetical protein